MTTEPTVAAKNESENVTPVQEVAADQTATDETATSTAADAPAATDELAAVAETDLVGATEVPATTPSTQSTQSTQSTPSTQSTQSTPSTPSTPSPAVAEVETRDPNTTGENKSRISIGSQRVGDAVAEPKAVAQARANPLGGDAEASDENVPAQEVRSTLGLDGNDVDLNLDDATIGDMLAGSTGEASGTQELVVDQKYQAKVVRLNEENVFVLIKDRFDGIVPTRTFKKKPADGDLIEVVVTRHNTEEGIYELRIPGGAIDAAAWDDLAEGALLEVKITGSNTGGLECIINGIRGFVPGSQIDLNRVENFGDYVGKKMELLIQEVNKKKKKLILSRRAILEKEQKEKQKEFLQTLEAGAYYDGTVTRLMDFGAFIDIGSGVEGLAHVSKLSWDRIKHPKDAVAVGQTVRVKLEKINPENGKISLSVKDTMTNPWYGIAERYPDGTVVKGNVTKLADFGAFVALEAGIEGMVHISELAHGRVSTVNSVVKVGDEIDVKVLSIDIKKRRIALSRRATMDAPAMDTKVRDKSEPEEKRRELAVKPTKESLKGGRGKDSGGEQFGLRW